VKLGKYLKRAFTNRWNLLALFGGLGFAALASPAVLIPLVLAGEIAYLGFLGTHPKFQSYIEAQEHKAARGGPTVSAEERQRQILASLTAPLRERFDALRSRCLEIRRIALELRQSDEAAPGGLEALQLAGLDRLLWIFLRLLYTKQAIERFLERTHRAEIEANIERLETRLARVGAGDTATQQKIRATIEDTLATSRDRLANLEKAEASHELLDLEIDRLENKIQTLSEMAINRHEPGFIVSQVDQVATSMLETERTMNDLEFATGLTTGPEAVPKMLRAQVEVTK
jgi:hypothetical protein